MNERITEELSPGEMKVQEYVARINAGESKEEIFEGLPQSFRDGIDRALSSDDTSFVSFESVVPEDISETQSDRESIEAIEKELGISHASEQEGDEEALVATLDQDQFAEWLVEHVTPEDARKVDIYTLLTVRPENRLAFLEDALSSGAQQLVERRIAMLPTLRAWATEAEKVLNAHKDGAIRGVSGTGWNHFVINEGEVPKEEDRAKGYVCLSGEEALTQFTPVVMEDILESLRGAGYHGQVKFPMTGGQLFDKFDNIVVHGDSDEETLKALTIIRDVLATHVLEVKFTQSGKDGIDEEGKKTSHSDLLAKQVYKKIYTE